MKEIGYYNGVYAPIGQISVPMNDRGYYFGDGVYDAVLVRNKVGFTLGEHLDRLYGNAEKLDIHITQTKGEMAGILQKAIDQVDAPEAFLYVQVTRGTAPRTHAFPDPQVKPNVMAYVKPIALKSMDVPYRLISTEDTRWLHCDIKSLNLLVNVMAAQKAVENGCGETVFHRGADVTECSSSNLLILKDGVLKTPPLSNLILPGITRRHILGVARRQGIPVAETPLTMEDLFGADELFFTSTSKLCRYVNELDGQPVGGKAPALRKALQQAFWQEIVEAT